MSCSCTYQKCFNPRYHHSDSGYCSMYLCVDACRENPCTLWSRSRDSLLNRSLSPNNTAGCNGENDY